MRDSSQRFGTELAEDDLLTLHADTSGEGPKGNGGGQADAVMGGYGVMKLFANAVAIANDQGKPYGYAEAEGHMQIAFTMDVPEGPLKDTPGKFIARWDIDGSLTTSFSGAGTQNSSAYFRFWVWNSPVNFIASIANGEEYTSDSTVIYSEHSFNWGDRVTLGPNALVAASTEPTARPDQTVSSTATALFFNTIRWGGIVSAEDADGNPVTDFTAFDKNGKDWLIPAPVPEPSTLTILMVGFSLVLRGSYRHMFR
ncbi:MAG: hypothetical protein KDA57_17445 [Planctomycetales bacterium]|nr:hypothetical protein [Planctomycetales bacterium]